MFEHTGFFFFPFSPYQLSNIAQVVRMAQSKSATQSSPGKWLSKPCVEVLGEKSVFCQESECAITCHYEIMHL